MTSEAVRQHVLMIQHVGHTSTPINVRIHKLAVVAIMSENRSEPDYIFTETLYLHLNTC